MPALLEQGHILNGIDRQTGGTNGLTMFHHADVNDAEHTAAAVAGAEVVVHLPAAKDDWGITADEYDRDNVAATQTLLEAGKQAGVADWVFFSTVSVYGPSKRPVDESASHRPINPYGRSKAAAEALFSSLATADGASVLAIRPSVVFGPRHPTSTNVSRLVELNWRRKFVMVGRGDALKTTSYIENLTAATIYLMGLRTSGVAPSGVAASGVAAYNYTDLPLLTAGEMVNKIRTRLGQDPLRLRVPLAVGVPLGWAGTALAAVTKRNMPITADRIRKFNTSTAFSSAKIRDLGFTQPVSTEDALDRTVEWHLAQK